MNLLSRVWNVLTAKGTPRFDKHGIHRSWKYNPEDEKELTAVLQFAGYATSHGVSQRKLNVCVKNNAIHFNSRVFMWDPVLERYKHYLVYPDWVRSHDSPTRWSITLEKARELDPEYHYRCSFYHSIVGSCNYCNGINEDKIG